MIKISITVKVGRMKVRDRNGNNVSLNMVAEESTERMLGELQAKTDDGLDKLDAKNTEITDAIARKGDEVKASLPTDYTALNGRVQELNDDLVILDSAVYEKLELLWSFGDYSVSNGTWVKRDSANIYISHADLLNVGKDTLVLFENPISTPIWVAIKKYNNDGSLIGDYTSKMIPKGERYNIFLEEGIYRLLFYKQYLATTTVQQKDSIIEKISIKQLKTQSYDALINSIESDVSNNTANIDKLREQTIRERTYGATSKVAIENVRKSSNVNLVFFSDIHNEPTNFARIVEYANKHDVDAIVNGGDTVSFIINEGISWYTSLVNKSGVDVLECLGNHDIWKNQAFNYATKAEVYNMFIAPMVARTDNIIQPSSAPTTGKSYYYKDYDSVRIISLVAMYINDGNKVFWDNEQKEWLQNVLADALTNNKSVICVNHTPFKKDISVRLNTKWNSIIDYTADTSHKIFDSMHLALEAMDCVQDFISAGGDFICWLGGHTHMDNMLKATGYNGQTNIVISSANNTKHADGYGSNSVDDYNFDCFNHIGVDTTNKLIKVYRVGYNMDMAMQEHNILCFNYKTQTIVAEA